MSLQLYEMDVCIFTRPVNRRESQTRTFRVWAESRAEAVETLWSALSLHGNVCRGPATPIGGGSR